MSRLDIQATVLRLQGARWHLPKILSEADKGKHGEVWCGATGKRTGMAVGTAGLPICDECLEAVRRHQEASRG